MSFELTVTIKANQSLLNALETLAAAFKSVPAEAPKKNGKAIPLGEQPPETNKAAGTEVKVTIEEIRALVKVKAKKDRDKVTAILKKYEADSVTVLKEEHYEAFYNEIQAA
jgi:hypothetical protein